MISNPIPEIIKPISTDPVASASNMIKAVINMASRMKNMPDSINARMISPRDFATF